MKICIKCKINKDINQFSFIKHIEKYKGTCKECIREYQRSPKQRDKANIRQKKENLTDLQINKKRKYDKERYNTPSRIKWRKNYQIGFNLKPKTTEQIKNRRLKNNKNEKDRKSKDLSFKLRKNVSRSIIGAIKNNNSSKCKASFLKFISYSVKELKEHLESQFEPWMTWENWGNYNKFEWNDSDQLTWTWQIDHIIPQSNLPYSSMEDANFKKCWALVNLRPYSAKQNLLDGVFRLRHQ